MGVTSSRSWAVRMILFLISVLLWNVWRLAIAWNVLLRNPFNLRGKDSRIDPKAGGISSLRVSAIQRVEIIMEVNLRSTI